MIELEAHYKYTIAQNLHKLFFLLKKISCGAKNIKSLFSIGQFAIFAFDFLVIVEKKRYQYIHAYNSFKLLKTKLK